MNPWTVIGWAVLSVMALVVATIVAKVGSMIGAAWLRLVRHLRTRNTPPAKGQVWIQGDSRLQIREIYDNGRIGIQAGAGSWSDSPKEWRTRVKNRRVYLAEVGA